LIEHAGLTFWILAAIIMVAIAAFFALVMATKIITGEERIIYYHHEIAVMLMAALFLRINRQPLFPYLDITIIGIGTFLIFGRIGCLMMGCCHGRPHRWGVRYSEEHAADGFPSYLVGVRLFPIQVVESFWVLCTVIVGTLFVWKGSPPGTALAWYVITYDLGRFCFEFARGDADRPYWLGFSQPQWLSLFLTGGVSWAESAGILPLFRWHIVTFAALAVAMLAISLKRHFDSASGFQLLHPRHIRQLASAMRSMSAVEHATTGPDEPMVVSMASTSLGIQISAGTVDQKNERIYHYAISGGNPQLSARAARTLLGMIRKLNGVAGTEKQLAGGNGVFHLLIRTPVETNS
jgi:hypothetical protein